MPHGAYVVHYGPVAAIWALVTVISSHSGAIVLPAPNHMNHVFQPADTLAFNSFELAKIFGRLTDQSPIGSVLATPTCSNLDANVQKRRKWHGIFEREDEEIDSNQFRSRLAATKLVWPTYYVANRQTPYLVPDKQRHKFKLKGYLGHVVPTDLQKTNVPKEGDPRDQKVVNIGSQPLDKAAADTVFKALSHKDGKLTINHILAFIKYHSPLLEMVNWETFIASLPVGPDDIPV
ncbi:putative integral membrane protein [Babesia bovis T2Bo]|uniref:Uncharacterized protein n=1 Tax=Babesia bovis TaxID=5865 RepID=A7AVD8_BABBO|nr:putative integral membrane protein [Babesia bovis T2Bo]EDO05764.1 putative integral membrane protein [Babesia bovis T2Bo]|eukprot:XP_001609332.1 hypothetical protein [Babesia bovis T2Bo]